jgi:hypothetical protein
VVAESLLAGIWHSDPTSWTQFPKYQKPHCRKPPSKAGETVWPPYWNGLGGEASGRCGGATQGDGSRVVDSNVSDVSGQFGSGHGQ